MTRSVKVGIFLVGGLVLFCVGLFLIGTRAQLFNHQFTVYAQFNDIQTLEAGAKVRVAGMNAGQIEAIQVPAKPNQPFRLTLQLDRKFRSIVRRDSLASIETEGMVGNKFVNIAKGSAKAPECSGCTLPAQEEVSMDQLMQRGNDIAQSIQSTIGDLHQRADTILQNVDGASASANTMLAQAKPNVVGLTRNANALVAGIRQGQGAAGQLLVDKKVASDVTQTIANARQASANVRQTTRKIDAMTSQVRQSDLPAIHQTLANTQDATHKIDQSVGGFLAKGNHNENTVAALRDTIHGAQQTMTNLSDDTDAVKHNFFLRGFFHRRGYFDLSTITPDQYARSKFVQHPRARVWLSAAQLFQIEPNGSQQLTAAGRSTLDENMSALVPYLPNNPIVVEGYDVSSDKGQGYVVARQRAVEVAAYLKARFHLQPDQVGTIPLGDRPPARTGKRTWDGVCLVLVTWKK